MTENVEKGWVLWVEGEHTSLYARAVHIDSGRVIVFTDKLEEAIVLHGESTEDFYEHVASTRALFPDMDVTLETAIVTTSRSIVVI